VNISIAAAVTFLAASPAPLRLAPCTAEDGAPAQARCGALQVPEDWSRPEGRRIGLHVVVAPAARPRPGEVPLFELAGGPGIAASAGAAELFGDYAALREHRDVVLVDQRGTGRSAPLRCPEIEAQGPLREMYPVEMVRACRERLEARADLTQYTTANAARDLDAVRSALGHERIDLDGLSYGTVLAMTYLKLFPDRVRRVVLMGAAAPDAKMPLGHGAAAQQALEAVFTRCAADARCRAAFPDLRREWAAVLARLEKGPVRVRRRAETGASREVEIRRDIFGEAFRGVLGARPWDVPFVIHRMAEDDWGPFLDRLDLDGPSPFAEGLYLSVTCAEGTSRITDAEAAESARGTFLDDYRVAQQRRACAGWPHATVEPAHLAPPRSAVPTLFLSGTSDHVTPPEIAARLMSGFTRSQQVLIEGLPHFPSGLRNMECYDRLILSFFEKPEGEPLDATCVATMKAPPFRTASDQD
jgi:pimeloyl-ACP methyl ester carboxylesterase